MRRRLMQAHWPRASGSASDVLFPFRVWLVPRAIGGSMWARHTRRTPPGTAVAFIAQYAWRNHVLLSHWCCSPRLRALDAARWLLRLYGREKPLFDKTWTLPDIEEIK